MKMSKLIIPLVLAVLGAITAISGFAQSRNQVGINLVLKPIQTIHIDDKRDQSDRFRKLTSDRNKPNRQVAAFGTTSYQLEVDSILIGTLPIGETALPEYVVASKYKAVYLQNKRATYSALFDRPLLIYSIQVK
ncbi:hypothetical protein GCM10011386_26280 [Parapedobacter defluvii]|uniref:Uncharacterized protein n=2 Tax=Parapedobacter defluvii TaxID=2045106 RepID=A0ABQ1M0R3_9SPHI|nr:hypothetical protein GCM10011386_26280 [Parapedobacter defluvii]